MGSRSKTHIPHFEAISFINNLKLKIKCKARRIQSSQNLSYTDAFTLACRSKLGLQNRYQFNAFCKELSDRAEFFASQNERIRCASQEMPEEGMNYYIFYGTLDLEGFDGYPVEAVLTPRRIKTLMSSWVGWADDERNIEMRVADWVNPKVAIERYRESLKQTVYVINNKKDLFVWLLAWGGIALVREDLVVSDKFLSAWLTPYKNEDGWR